MQANEKIKTALQRNLRSGFKHSIKRNDLVYYYNERRKSGPIIPAPNVPKKRGRKLGSQNKPKDVPAPKRQRSQEYESSDEGSIASRMLKRKAERQSEKNPKSPRAKNVTPWGQDVTKDEFVDFLRTNPDRIQISPHDLEYMVAAKVIEKGERFCS